MKNKQGIIQHKQIQVATWLSRFFPQFQFFILCFKLLFRVYHAESGKFLVSSGNSEK